MVLVIVTRNIDLSVGSMLGATAMLMGIFQVWVLPQYLGLGHPAIWILTVLFGLVIGTLIGTFHEERQACTRDRCPWWQACRSSWKRSPSCTR